MLPDGNYPGFTGELWEPCSRREHGGTRRGSDRTANVSGRREAARTGPRTQEGCFLTQLPADTQPQAQRWHMGHRAVTRTFWRMKDVTSSSCESRRRSTLHVLWPRCSILTRGHRSQLLTQPRLTSGPTWGPEPSLTVTMNHAF